MPVATIKRIVLDASVAVAWCFEDEKSHFTEGILDLLSAGTEFYIPNNFRKSDYLCPSHACLSSNIPARRLQNCSRLSIGTAMPLPHAPTAHEIA